MMNKIRMVLLLFLLVFSGSTYAVSSEIGTIHIHDKGNGGLKVKLLDVIQTCMEIEYDTRVSGGTATSTPYESLTEPMISQFDDYLIDMHELWEVRQASDNYQFDSYVVHVKDIKFTARAGKAMIEATVKYRLEGDDVPFGGGFGIRFKFANAGGEWQLYAASKSTSRDHWSDYYPDHSEDVKRWPLPGTIYGTIRDDVTGLPIQGVVVTTSGGAETTSDANGLYVFNDTAGTYTLWADKNGYHRYTGTVLVVALTTRMKNFRMVPY